MRFTFLLVGFIALVAIGCGSDATARVKGRLVENGQPKTFPPSTYSVEIAPLDASGKPDANKMYTAVVNADGSFEMLASGGKIIPGKYEFSVRGGAASKKGPPPKGSTRDIVSGENDITLDIAKPGE
jgi:hypothetical protein